MSVDGYSSGPGGPAEDRWLHEHAADPATLEHFEGIWRGCSSVLVGRNNYLGFHSVWPGITRADDTDPRTRELGRWLDAVDKAVVSTTLDDAPWSHSRIFRDPRSAVGALRAEPGRDVLVLNSATLIGSLLREDLVDDLRLAIVPVLLGGGLRLLPDDVAGAWSMVSTTVLPNGAVSVHHRRRR
ncbi:dihydrofolate reductase family protein [Pseudonocardia kongjuensis]|uniref:Dihydrofolate reductase family protein n=1 Tax=Pseudonocardia kongjuensis TaxID=102227 RepID=A0ABN1Y711_9PSEU